MMYDAATLKVASVPTHEKTVGEYNVWNKTRLSSGTSHWLLIRDERRSENDLLRTVRLTASTVCLSAFADGGVG